MFRTKKPWLAVYEGRVEPETEVFEGSLYDLFRRSVEEHRGKTALTFYGTEFAFERLHALVEKMAASLAAAGVKKGDRVALMLPNCPQYVISFFAVVRLGAVVTQVNPMYVEREIEHILEDSGSETIVVFENAYPRVKTALPNTSLKNVIVAGLGEEPRDLDAGHHGFGEFLSADADPAPRVEIDAAEDVAALQYTGGTTGVSKGAMLTHRNLAANVRQTIDVFVDDPGAVANNQKVVAVLPFFHIYGFTCVMLFGVVLGLNQILLPRFHEVRTFTSGGAALPVNLKRSFEEKAGRPLFEGYGLSEASPVTHFNPPFTGRAREGSIGVPIPSTDARIADLKTGETEVPVGESGELVIKGPQVMKGYWGIPDETAQTLRDGWLYTGDIATMDEDGYFYIVDRKKDMILAGGFNVYPREIEEVLFEHPDVAEAVAIGVPDEYRGETVKAFVVKREGSAITEEEIIAFCGERLAAYKAPKAVEFRDFLPKSTVGKLLRRVLADEERERAGMGTQTATGAPPPPSPS